MATKEELEARETDCSSATDFADLAVAAKDVDADYAKAMLEKAEMQCQLPPDYVAAAEGAIALGLTDYAKDLFEQAEDACFESMELATLGAALARTGVDVDKGREMLEKAAGEASKLDEFLIISGYAKEALGDEELAASLLAKVEAKATDLADYVDLAKTLAEDGSIDAARGFYAKAARHLDGMPDTVEYAKGFISIFDDKDGAKKVLDDAGMDCQFPKDFAALAAAFKEVLGDDAKVAELMDQAADYAMSGEENLDLAKGYWQLLADKDKAVEAYGKALSDVNDKAQLMELAGYIASQVGVADLAKQFYAKAEGKMSAAPERLKLAEAVIRDTGDKDYAGEVYGRAAESLTQPNDLMSVAANVVDQLGDKVKSGQIYRKAFAGMGDLGQYMKLLEAVDAKLGDKAFAKEILESAGAVAASTPELLDVAKRAIAVIADKDMAKAFLDQAEEQVTSVGEMKNLVEAVKTNFADDAGWIALVEEKLTKREANQEKYAVFQKREKDADSTIKVLRLADAVMAELDDKFYAQKLLIDAQTRLNDEGWDFSKARKLVAGVSAHLGDTEWATKLLKDAAQRMRGFTNLTTVAESAAELLPDKETANAFVTELLADWEQKLDAGAAQSAYDYSKLASVRGRLLGDKEAAAASLDKAAAKGGNHFTFAELARVAQELGLDDKAAGLLDQAKTACNSAAQAQQLVGRLLQSGFAKERVKEIYTGLKNSMATGADQIRWADAVAGLFGDREMAKVAFDQVESGLSGDELADAKARRARRVGHMA